MRRPPECVAVVARHHWLMSGAILFFFGLLYVFTRNSHFLTLSRKTYAFCLGLGALYGMTGALVWLGSPLGRTLNYVCCLVYLTRPQLGSRLWRMLGSVEFKAHFAPRKN